MNDIILEHCLVALSLALSYHYRSQSWSNPRLVPYRLTSWQKINVCLALGTTRVKMEMAM